MPILLLLLWVVLPVVITAVQVHAANGTDPALGGTAFSPAVADVPASVFGGATPTPDGMLGFHLLQLLLVLSVLLLLGCCC